MPLFDLLKTLTGRKILVYADFIDPFCYVRIPQFAGLWLRSMKVELEWLARIRAEPGHPARKDWGLATAGNSDLRPGMWASVQGYARKAGLDLPRTPSDSEHPGGPCALLEISPKNRL